MASTKAIMVDAKPTQLRDETIIYFGPEDWDGLWRSRHQLMSRLAHHNKVIYVDPAKLLRPVLREFFRNGGKIIAQSTSCATKDESGVLVFHSPWWLPLTGRRPFRQISVWLYLKFLARVCKLQKDCSPIVWLSRPTMSDFIGRLNEKLSIYHVVDEYAAYTGVDAKTREWLNILEQLTMSRVDLVVVVTPALLKKKAPHNPNTYLVPNAVNFAAYAEGNHEIPKDMAGIPKPIIGFTGLFSARLDLGLIQQAAKSKPDWSFVFIGAIDDAECTGQLSDLRRLANVHFLGSKPLDSLPCYLRNFDICTIPYAGNMSAEHASPLKLYEYAAVSRPIVTTDFPAARDFEGNLQIINSVGEYISACEQSLQMSRSDRRLVQNRNFAAKNTWEDRVAQISEIIQKKLPPPSD